MVDVARFGEIWTTVWWCPLLQRRIGWFPITPFVRGYGTRYRWRPWREVVLEQSEDLNGDFMQTICRPNGEEIVRRIPSRVGGVGT